MASNASTTVPYYTPDARLTWMHGWARGNIAAGLAPAPNEFAADWAEGAGRDYYEGVLSLAAAYFVVGVLFFALIVVVNLAAFCCRSAAAKRRRGACARTLACLTAPAYWYLAACALMGVLTAVALSQTVQFKTTVSTRARARAKESKGERVKKGGVTNRKRKREKGRKVRALARARKREESWRKPFL